MSSRLLVRPYRAGSAPRFALALFLIAAATASAEQRWSGKVTDASGSGLAGVAASFDAQRAVTDETGRFIFALPAAGTWALELSAGPYSTTRQITLPPPSGEQLVIVVDWPLVIQETQEVYAVSKRTERLMEAPAGGVETVTSRLSGSHVTRP